MPTFAEELARVRGLDAEAFRLLQAERLLRECGFVEQPDGTWDPPED